MPDFVRAVLDNPELAELRVEFEKLIRPVITANLEPVADDEIPIGHSKFGGCPDLPEGIEWPIWFVDPDQTDAFTQQYESNSNLFYLSCNVETGEVTQLPYTGIAPPKPTGTPRKASMHQDNRCFVHLPFLAQIRLSQIQHLTSEGLLPSVGMLYIFFDLEFECQTEFSDQLNAGCPAWKVIFHPNETATLTRVPVPEDVGLPEQYRPIPLCFFRTDYFPYVFSKPTDEDDDAWEVGGIQLSSHIGHTFLNSLDHGGRPEIFFGSHDDVDPFDLCKTYFYGQRWVFPELEPFELETFTGDLTPEVIQALTEVKFLFCIDLETITLEPKPWSFRRLAVFIREQDLRACDFSRVWFYTVS
jgi:hypothetical protein